MNGLARAYYPIYLWSKLVGFNLFHYENGFIAPIKLPKLLSMLFFAAMVFICELWSYWSLKNNAIPIKSVSLHYSHIMMVIIYASVYYSGREYHQFIHGLSRIDTELGIRSGVHYKRLRLFNMVVMSSMYTWKITTGLIRYYYFGMAVWIQSLNDVQTGVILTSFGLDIMAILYRYRIMNEMLTKLYHNQTTTIKSLPTMEEKLLTRMIGRYFNRFKLIDVSDVRKDELRNLLLSCQIFAKSTYILSECFGFKYISLVSIITLKSWACFYKLGDFQSKAYNKGTVVIVHYVVESIASLLMISWLVDCLREQTDRTILIIKKWLSKEILDKSTERDLKTFIIILTKARVEITASNYCRIEVGQVFNIISGLLMTIILTTQFAEYYNDK